MLDRSSHLTSYLRRICKKVLSTRVMVKTKATEQDSVTNDGKRCKITKDSKAVSEIDHSIGPAWFLIKNEPDEFSIDDLLAIPNKTSRYDGIRNMQARKHMRSMRVGDQIFFYQSSCKVPGICAVVEVVKEAYPDHMSWEEGHKYFDPKSTPDNPRWFMMDFKFVRMMKRFISLEELKGHQEDGLEGMPLFKQSRLSIQPVASHHVEFLLKLEEQPAANISNAGSSKKGGEHGKKRKVISKA
ncbi:hypothetical protein CEUSTIGMA_g13291.t1 [Chlamydomonas eustigma]|uniref:Thymocyte nuclear protein 1 n=1 Tax=Chlamydomonas eustigma TaxID=1157962 RepID=A0A250XS46_9CHLO|nr:hypothetical protein CEUSTIGMA_g13291.t1 [Chlamydomonas eustigma]|eukprot:GAX85875.1 hypothetical protein CEUSTIGMA_g13291.t1 [Chlamydomonas eustigma]